eukprot:Rmarinus@m.3768
MILFLLSATAFPVVCGISLLSPRTFSRTEPQSSAGQSCMLRQRKAALMSFATFSRREGLRTSSQNETTLAARCCTTLPLMGILILFDILWRREVLRSFWNKRRILGARWLTMRPTMGASTSFGILWRRERRRSS